MQSHEEDVANHCHKDDKEEDNDNDDANDDDNDSKQLETLLGAVNQK